jgi:trimethylamine:corrinoid methyltransferase-like protein
MNSKISGSSTVVAAREQVSCDLAGEVAILDVKSGIYYGLNAIGARIWHLIQAPQTVDAVCETILAEYDVEADRCERDILMLLQELVANGLVEIRNGTTT